MNPSNIAVSSHRRSYRAALVNVNVDIAPQQIEEARAWLTEAAPPEMLEVPHGQRRAIMQLLRQGINESRISDIPQNPPDDTLEALYNQSIGLGILEEFLADPQINQINVIGPQQIDVQVNGVWKPIEDKRQLFRDREELWTVAENIARRRGRELSPYNEPILDLRMGTPPLRIHINMLRRDHGMSIFIRRARSKPFSIQKLIEMGDFNKEIADLLIEAAQRLIGCVIIGPVGVGKTVILESYIDHMPAVPIALVDDAGDCNPTHSSCAVFDVPSPSYNPNAKPNVTLGSMTRAALREGQVLVVAETRGAEEAGILISESPSMKAVCTTAHGASATAGLSRLVTIAQRSDAYRGGGDKTALREDLTNAFPLVIEMMQRGDRRFISKMYHNQGWDDKAGEWKLRTVATVAISNSGLSWEILDGDLDTIREQVALDRMNRGATYSYNKERPGALARQARECMARNDWGSAIDLLSRVVQQQYDLDRICPQLIQALEQAGRHEEPRQEAATAVQHIRSLIASRQWRKADAALQLVMKKPSVYAFSRKQIKVRRVHQEVQEAIENQEKLERQQKEGEELLRMTLPWQEFERFLQSLGTVDINLLTDDWKQVAKRLRAKTLAKIISVAPQENALQYEQELVELIGVTEALRVKEALERETGVPDDGGVS